MLRKKYLVAASCVARAAAREIKQQVGRDAHQLEPHEQKHQLVGRGDQHRPGIDHEQGAEKLARPIVGWLAMCQRQQDQPASVTAPSRA